MSNGLLIQDTTSDVSIIQQSGSSLDIQSCGISNTVSSIISMYVTDSGFNNVVAMTITDDLVTVNPQASFTSTTAPISSATQPNSTNSSNKMPTTAWVQTAITSRPAYITSSFLGSPAVAFNTSGLNTEIYTSPSLTKGVYLATGWLTISFTGNVDNLFLEEQFTSLSGVLSTTNAPCYQYPNTLQVSITGNIVYASFSMTVTTLETGVVNMYLTPIWGGNGDISLTNGVIQISYLGSSAGAV